MANDVHNHRPSERTVERSAARRICGSNSLQAPSFPGFQLYMKVIGAGGQSRMFYRAYVE